MEDILRDLGMEDLIEVFRQNEVGPTEVVSLTDQEFAELGVRPIGRRAQLRNRCRVYNEGLTEESPVIRRIRDFQARRRGTRPTTARNIPPKPTRKLTIGWINRVRNRYTQVSAAKGGGSHGLDANKQFSLDELTTAITDVFLPRGRSVMQGLNLADLDVSLATFTGEPLPAVLDTGEDFTVDGYCRQVGKNPVRIYLHTVPKETTEETQPSQAPQERPETALTLEDPSTPALVPPVSSLVPPVSSLLSTVPSTVSLPTAASFSPSAQLDQVSPVGDAVPALQNINTLSSDSDSYIEAGTPDIEFRVQTDPIVAPADQNSNEMQLEINQAFSSLQQSLLGEETVTVNRQNLLADIFRLYSDANMPLFSLRVEFLGESGDDLGGLTKDFFTNAWKILLEQYFYGEDAVVPFLPLHRMREDKEKFKIIGRFMSHMAASLRVLPPRISRCSFLAMVFGQDSASDETLLEDFLLFSSPADRALLKRALEHFEILSQRQREQIVNFFSIHQLHELPTSSKIHAQILSIAQDVMLDKPAPFIGKIRQGIPELHLDIFWSLLTTDSIHFVFTRQRPTANKVVASMQPSSEDLRPDEERSFYFLKQFVSDLDQDDLADFLLFVTGRTLMPEEVKITFRHAVGASRCPVAHTCANLLELPSTYTSLQDLKREFRAILTNEHSFEMSIL